MHIDKSEVFFSKAWIDGEVMSALYRLEERRVEHGDLELLELFFRASVLYDDILTSDIPLSKATLFRNKTEIFKSLATRYSISHRFLHAENGILPPNLRQRIEAVINLKILELEIRDPGFLEFMVGSFSDDLDDLDDVTKAESIEGRVNEVLAITKNHFADKLVSPLVAIAAGMGVYLSEKNQQTLEKDLCELDYRRQPEKTLLKTFDESWKKMVTTLTQPSCLVPPFLGIVLSNVGDRSEISVVLKQLKDELQPARRNLHAQIREIAHAQTLAEQVERNRELDAAFSNICIAAFPKTVRPVRRFWRWIHFTIFQNYSAGKDMLDDDIANQSVALVDFADQVCQNIKKMRGMSKLLRNIFTTQELSNLGIMH